MTNGWHAGVKRLVIFLILVAGLAAAFAYVRSGTGPPREKKVIQNFYTHRVAYERLRDMLLADEHVLRVASWGVQTTQSIGSHVPSEGNFPVARYNEYLELLKQTGGLGASRGRGVHPESVGVLVWTSGWAGDTRHVAICWLDHEPANVVISLDDYYKTSKPRRPVFRHVDENWYLWSDW
jgi:hypothetical protein